jgi:hypothetical protein
VNQTISGITLADFRRDYAKNVLTIQITASSVMGLSSKDEIMIIKPTSGVTAYLRYATIKAQLEPEVQLQGRSINAVQTQYVTSFLVKVGPQAAQAYSKVTSSLAASVASGAFTALMQSTARSLGASLLKANATTAVNISQPVTAPDTARPSPMPSFLSTPNQNHNHTLNSAEGSLLDPYIYKTIIRF